MRRFIPAAFDASNGVLISLLELLYKVQTHLFNGDCAAYFVLLKNSPCSISCFWVTGVSRHFTLAQFSFPCRNYTVRQSLHLLFYRLIFTSTQDELYFDLVFLCCNNSVYFSYTQVKVSSLDEKKPFEWGNRNMIVKYKLYWIFQWYIWGPIVCRLPQKIQAVILCRPVEMLNT